MRSVAGDAHAHQNPGLLALSVVWLRYHNAMATRLHAQHPTWNDERLFHAARRRVIAILQVSLRLAVTYRPRRCTTYRLVSGLGLVTCGLIIYCLFITPGQHIRTQPYNVNVNVNVQYLSTRKSCNKELRRLRHEDCLQQTTELC